MINLKQQRSQATYILVFFAILILIVSLYTEFFQKSQVKLSIKDIYKNPINKDQLANLKKVVIHNRFGSFELQLVGNNQDQWELIKPREISAKSNAIDIIKKSLSNLQIIKVHQYDTLNLNNYQLREPSIYLKLFKNNDVPLTINLGLVNPIDNSLFMTVSNQQVIYQVTSFMKDIENLNLSDFIEDSIFTEDFKNLIEIKIITGHISNGNILTHAIKQNEQWTHNKINLNEDKLNKYYQNLQNISSKVILDKMDQDTKSIIESELARPQYTLILKKKNGETLQYVLTHLTVAIPSLKIDKKEVFIIDGGQLKYPVIVNSKHMSLIYMTGSALR